MRTFGYILELRDKMSGTLRRIGAGVADTDNKVNDLKKDVNGLNNLNLSGLLNIVKSIAPVLGAGALIGKTLRDGMENEMRETSFEVLFKGADNAKRMIDDITSYASKAYGKSVLSESSQIMASFTLPQDEIIPYLKAIGDIAMGDANKMKSLTLAFSQMSSTGQLTGQDLNQMINQGFNPLQVISEKTGKSIGQLKDEMSKGKISSADVKQAFIDATSEGGQYHGMIDKISNSAAGKWQLSIASFNERILDLYKIIQPLLIPALDKLNKVLKDPIGAVDKLINKFPILTGIITVTTAAIIGHKLAILSLAGAQAIIAGIKSALVAYEIVVFAVKNATSLWTAAQWILNVALGANPVGIIIAAIVALIALITYLIVKFDGWGKTWDNLMTFCKLVFETFIAQLKFDWLVVQDLFLKGMELIERNWYKLQSLWNKDSANEGLARLQEQGDKRAKEIAGQLGKLNELNQQMSSMKVWEVKSNDKTFSSVVSGLKNKLGISEAGIPGMNTPGGLDNTSNIDSGSGSGLKDTANSIATGGSKTTHVTINSDSLVHNIELKVSEAKEGASQIRDMILEELTRVLAMAQGQLQ